MKAAQPENCTICQTTLQGTYCHACGQKHTGKEAGFLLLLQETIGTFFSLEKSGGATLWALLRKPRFVVMNYIEGNRGYLQSPNKLIFYALVLFGLHVLLVDQEVLNMSFDIEGFNPAWSFLTLVLPFLVLSSWLLHGPKRIPLAHHLVAVSYFFALWFIILTILGDALYALFNNTIFVDFVLFLLLVCGFSARVFAAHKPVWQQILLGLIQVLLFFALLALLVGVIYLLGGRVSKGIS